VQNTMNFQELVEGVLVQGLLVVQHVAKELMQRWGILEQQNLSREQQEALLEKTNWPFGHKPLLYAEQQQFRNAKDDHKLASTGELVSRIKNSKIPFQANARRLPTRRAPYKVDGALFIYFMCTQLDLPISS